MNPSADAFFGLDNDDDTISSRNVSNETYLTRNDLERDSFAEQGLFGFTARRGTRHQKRSMANLAVRRMGDVVIGPHFRYVVHCDLVEVPVGWTRSDYVSVADGEFSRSRQSILELMRFTRRFCNGQSRN
jgi:hypothetical protein